MANLHIADQETARLSSNSAYGAKTLLGLVDGDLATPTSAKAACYTGQATQQICDQIYARQCVRGFTVANNFSATFGSTFAAFFSSLPANSNRVRRMITG